MARTTTMKYRVEPIIVDGCDCEDCKAGRHPYLLYRLPATGTHWSAMSLQTYASAEEAKQHDWGIDFGPDAQWDDGSPVVVPEGRPSQAQPDERGMVPLDGKAFAKSAEALIRHLAPGLD
jgi:hypothetical protein